MSFRVTILALAVLMAAGCNPRNDVEADSASQAEDAYLRFATCADVIGSHHLVELGFEAEEAARLGVSTCSDELLVYAEHALKLPEFTESSKQAVVDAISRRMTAKLTEAYRGQ